MGGSAQYRGVNRVLNYASGNKKLDKKVADATNKVLDLAKQFEAIRNPGSKPDIGIYKELISSYGKDNNKYNSIAKQLNNYNRNFKSMSKQEQKAWDSVNDAITNWHYLRSNQLYTPLTYGATVPRDALRG